MSVAGSADTARSASDLQVSPVTLLTARLLALVEVCKPRIAVMALLTVTLGFSMGSEGGFAGVLWMHSMFGIGLVAAASSALNQWLERDSDALMPRTEARPLPSGRLTTWEVLLFGAFSGTFGVAYLAAFVNWTTSVLALSTLVLYVLAYTPLKRVTSLCTSLGAIPGALPPVLGWTAAGAGLDERALVLFGILFLWQFPHFFAIAWLYREQYEEAGLKMLPGASRVRGITGLLSIIYALALIPVSLMPSSVALAGELYWFVALVLGLIYLSASIQFARNESVAGARRLLYTSLIYLPLLLMVMTFNHLQLLR